MSRQMPDKLSCVAVISHSLLSEQHTRPGVLCSSTSKRALVRAELTQEFVHEGAITQLALIWEDLLLSSSGFLPHGRFKIKAKLEEIHTKLSIKL